mgnify:CR=1 FL=1
MSTVPAEINVCSVSLTRCQRECGRHCILKMMIPVCHFLQGNYITLTNMSDHDVERIVKYRLEPINISFQTTNPELRCKMLHNRFAGEALKKVDILYRGQIEMNGQIVSARE